MYTINTTELKKAMLDCGIKTNKQLSEITGINRNTIGDLMNGKLKPTMGVIYNIANALNLTSERAGNIFLVLTYIWRKKPKRHKQKRRENGRKYYKYHNNSNNCGDSYLLHSTNNNGN